VKKTSNGRFLFYWVIMSSCYNINYVTKKKERANNKKSQATNQQTAKRGRINQSKLSNILAISTINNQNARKHE